MCHELGPQRGGIVDKPKYVGETGTSLNPYGVHKGQIWESCDPRDREDGRVRTIEVLSVDVRNGEAEVVSHGLDDVDRRRTVKLDRFRPHKGQGYRLREEDQDRVA